MLEIYYQVLSLHTEAGLPTLLAAMSSSTPDHMVQRLLLHFVAKIGREAVSLGGYFPKAHQHNF